MNLGNAQATILLEIDGQVHIVGMETKNLEAITFLIKSATKLTVPTGKKQEELRKFLGAR